MDLIGNRVKHNKFGEGVIIRQEASYVSVKFMTEDEPKKFMYPSCFKTFLKLLDANVATQTEGTVKQHEEQERKKKQQTMERSNPVFLQRKCGKPVLSWLRL